MNHALNALFDAEEVLGVTGLVTLASGACLVGGSWDQDRGRPVLRFSPEGYLSETRNLLVEAGAVEVATDRFRTGIGTGTVEVILDEDYYERCRDVGRANAQALARWRAAKLLCGVLEEEVCALGLVTQVAFAADVTLVDYWPGADVIVGLDRPTPGEHPSEEEIHAALVSAYGDLTVSVPHTGTMLTEMASGGHTIRVVVR